jgi:hypothetical protein
VTPPKKFTPTANQIRSAELVFSCMALIATIRPVVEGYQRRILQENRWPISPEWTERARPLSASDGFILDPKDSYLLDDENSAKYFALCASARTAVGLTVARPGNCPLLEAESALVQAQHLLLKEMESASPLTLELALSSTMENYRKAVELNLKLLSPFVSRKSALARLSASPA